MFKFFSLVALLCIAEIRSEERAYLHLAAGAFSYKKEKYRAFEGHIEYRFCPLSQTTIRPLLGLMATHKRTLYGYGGFAIDYLRGPFFGAVSFAPGLYYKGKGKDLSLPLEFRSSIEAGFSLKNNWRVSLQFYHLSNASLGRRNHHNPKKRSKNPGEESLLLALHLPI